MSRPLEAVLADYDAEAPLGEASTIPSTWYTDLRIADLERRQVVGRSWQLVGRADEVAAPGDYVTADIAGEPVVVVRGADGILRGFFNVCRHHAAAVMTEPCGHAEKLTCPYHGWTYGLDGRLRSAPELEGVCHFDPAQNGLVPLGVATWGPLVFAHLDAKPPSLEAHLGDLPSRLPPEGLGSLRFAGRRAWTLECNWKVFVDNYLDGGYHVPYLHRGLASVLSHRDYTIETSERFCLQSSPIVASGVASGVARGVARGGDGDTASVRKGRALYFWLYPNLMLNVYDGYLDTNLVIPLAVDRTRVVFDFYFADVGEAARAANQRSMDVSARIQEEDLAICASVQRGLSSRAYGKGRLSVRREAGEHLFHRLLAADLRRPA